MTGTENKRNPRVEGPNRKLGEACKCRVSELKMKMGKNMLVFFRTFVIVSCQKRPRLTSL